MPLPCAGGFPRRLPAGRWRALSAGSCPAARCPESDPPEGPLPPLVATLVGVPVVLGLFGLFQWLILRRQVDEAVWWPIGNVSGLFLGLGTGFAVATSIFARTIPLLAPIDFPSAKALFIVGAVGGPLYAAMTWAVLGLLRPKSGSTGPTTSGT
jgi:hypothetical protein